MIPDWAWTWFVAISMIAITVGTGTAIVYFCAWVSEQMDFLRARRDDAERRLTDQREHDKRLLDLKFGQAKYITSLNMPDGESVQLETRVKD